MPETDLYNLYHKIENKVDFEVFLKCLLEDFGTNKSDWDNNTLQTFLEGLYGYNYQSDSNAQASWKLFAEMLLAARVYE